MPFHIKDTSKCIVGEEKKNDSGFLFCQLSKTWFRCVSSLCVKIKYKRIISVASLEGHYHNLCYIFLKKKKKRFSFHNASAVNVMGRILIPLRSMGSRIQWKYSDGQASMLNLKKNYNLAGIEWKQISTSRLSASHCCQLQQRYLINI